MMPSSLRMQVVFHLSGLLAVLCFLSSSASAQTCVEPPAGLTGWWPGDGSTEDLIGGRHAVLRDDATFGPGLVDQAFILDGDGDFVDVPHDPALNVGTSDFTVDLWVFFNDTAGEQILVEKYVEQFGPTTTGWNFTKLDDNSLAFFGANTGPLSLPANTWIHFTARRSGDVAAIFMNGTLVATGPVDLDRDLDSTSSLKFGHRGNPSDTPGSLDEREFFLNGRIDEVELFVGRALSDTEIQAIFNAGSAGKCKPTNRSCQGGRSHIRGRITTVEDTAGLPDVQVALEGPGACREATTTKALGFYRFPHLRDGTYTVTPRDDDCTFEPPSWIVTLEEGPARLNFEASCP